MPTYEYECRSCGETFERFQPITARPLRRCPVCRTGKVRRLIGAGAGFLFRGSGFYQTDYRSDEYRAKAKAETGGGEAKAETGGGEAKSTAKSDSKKPTDKQGGKTEK